MTTPLSTSARIVAELRERLKAEWNLEDGDEALETTLEGQTNLPELLAELIRQAVDCEDQSEAIGTRVKVMQGRAARCETKAASLRAIATWAMQEAGMKRIPADALPEMTATLSAGRAPLILSPDTEIPDTYMRVKTIREPDKVRIRAEIEAGERFAFAMLGNARPTLTIRTR